MSADDAEETPDRAVDLYKLYRSEDKHECDLFTARINTLLTSQSLLATAAAILAANGRVGPVRLIGWTGIAAALFVSLAIVASSRTLRRWHRFGNALVAKHPVVLGRYGYGRRQPDLFHLVSIEVLGFGLVLIAVVGWVVVLAHLG